MFSTAAIKSGGKHFDFNIDGNIADSWKTFYDAKDSLKHVEQRLQNTLSSSRNGRAEQTSVGMHPYDNLSSTSSNYLSIQPVNRTMLKDDVQGRSSRTNNYHRTINSNSFSTAPHYLHDNESRIRSSDPKSMNYVDIPIMNDKNVLDYRMVENKRSINSTHLDTDAFLQSIRRKINKQKLAAGKFTV
ncbi:unnamed protein product [Didymodactylos carnosus]|uniref:Uncharacterized protein n=1 Tax=Didymodactylos carnosus TaxID=1234261 RepID=A0A8S2EIL8_9BILA|nr:unnamed protein product [Didymodactylos carnosus]CAF3985133.1 unnamed protein product [Didymodactylos carnosus]